MSDPRDVMLRVRRADLVRWRKIAERQRAPLDVVIDRALVAIDADPDSDARLGAAVREAVAQHPPRRRKGTTTVPMVFDPAQAAAERFAALGGVPAPLAELEALTPSAEEHARERARQSMDAAIGIIERGILVGLLTTAMRPADAAALATERARNIAHALAHLIAPGVDL